MVCDDSDDHHAGLGMVVGLNGGAAKWRDKIVEYKLKKDDKITVGAKSKVKELTCLRAD